MRDGEFGLTNTNKLVRRYAGCTGLKTGTPPLPGTAWPPRPCGRTWNTSPCSWGRPAPTRALTRCCPCQLCVCQLCPLRPVPPQAIAPVRVIVGETGAIQPVLDAGTPCSLAWDLQGWSIRRAAGVRGGAGGRGCTGPVRVSWMGQSGCAAAPLCEAVARRSPVRCSLIFLPRSMGDDFPIGSCKTA